MKRYSKSEFLTEIINGNEEVLVFISREYFSSVRKMLRFRGIRDEETPAFFSEVLSNTYSGLRNRGDEKIDFETYFMNALNEELKSGKFRTDLQSPLKKSEEIAAKCVSILDIDSQKILFARVADKLSYERIKEEFQFGNSVIAQYEVTKALDQLEGIVKLRLNLFSN